MAKPIVKSGRVHLQMTVKVVPRVLQLFFTMNAAARRGEQLNPNVVVKPTFNTPPPEPRIKKRRCSMKDCKHRVDVTYKFAKCPVCLNRKNKWVAANHKHVLESSAAYHRSAAGRASRLRERQNGKKLASNARFRANHREALRRKGREAAATPMGLLSTSLRKMVKGDHWDPVSFAALGSFQTNEEAMAHFEEGFEPWMSWENRGAHKKGNAYNVTWNIGHALPRKIFDQTNEADLRRCWSPDNLFPQCARQNTELRDALIYTDNELLEMRHLWPAAANDDLEQLKGLFQFIDHDFICSKQVADAVC